MKKITLLFALLLSTVASAQGYYQVITGYNYTEYKFNNSQQETTIFDRGEGSFYELGYEARIASKDYLFYRASLSLNSFNGLGDLQGEALSWDTRFLGVGGGVLFKVPIKKAALRLEVGASIHHLIHGKQYIGGTLYNLRNTEEFKNVKLMANAGIGIEQHLTQNLAIHAGYAFHISALATSKNSTENLQMNTHQIRLGILIKSIY